MDVSSGLVITKSVKKGRIPITVLHLAGRINMSNADELENEARSTYEGGARDILLDLKEVPSLTSAGLRAIHTIYKMLSESIPASAEDPIPGPFESKVVRSPHLKISNPIPDVLKVLNMAGFTNYIDIFNNIDDAIASY